MRFEHPNLLWLLLVIPPALALFFWWRERRRQKLLTQFIKARLLSSLTIGLSPARRKIRFALLISAAALLIVALARPQYGFDLQTIEQRGLDIVVAIDTSKSMLAADITPNRLERAKLAALGLMQDAQSDRIGLEAFAGDAFLECPLTVDNAAFEQSVQGLDVNTIPEGGTAIAEAINTVLAAFKESDHYKALVLLTDGEDNVNESAALEAAQNAAKAGLKIFTVGIGTAEGSILRVTDGSGNSEYVRDPDGNVVKSHLNEALLQQIATTTGGFYLPLRGANTMDVLYERGLAPLPKSEGTERLTKLYHEQYHWPLAAAILLLLAEMLLPERRNVKVKAAGLPPAAVAAAVAILLLPAIAKGSPSSAAHDYENGNYTNALQEYTRLAGVETNDVRLIFNAGDAAYRATNYDTAQSLFQQAALSPDLKLQQAAFFNLGNTQFQMARNAKDLDGLQQGLEMAEKTYERAVGLNTNDADARFNLAFTQSAIEQIKKFREMMLRAKSEADAAVRAAEFHQALEIMAPLQKTIAAKQFEDFTKKLENIDAIATPPNAIPTPPK